MYGLPSCAGAAGALNASATIFVDLQLAGKIAALWPAAQGDMGLSTEQKFSWAWLHDHVTCQFIGIIGESV